jgi:hypothetical protein
MTISAQCPHCQRTYNLPDQQAGKTAKCKCGQQFLIPQPVLAEPELEPLDDDLMLQPLAAELPPLQPLQPTSAFAQPAQRGSFQQPAFQQPAFKQSAPATTTPISTNGLWRAGGLLVMQSGAFLPQHVCIKTGEAAATTLNVKLTWIPAWVHFTIIFGRIIHYAIVRSHGREAQVKVGLSSGTALKRNLAIYGGYGMVGLGFLSFFGYMGLMIAFHQEGDPYTVWPLLIGGMMIGIGALVAHFGGKLISAKGINNRFVVIRGVSWRVLDSLPEWRGEVPRGEGA